MIFHNLSVDNQTTTMMDTNQKAEIINTSVETVEKVQIYIFVNFKDSKTK